MIYVNSKHNEHSQNELASKADQQMITNDDWPMISITKMLKQVNYHRGPPPKGKSNNGGMVGPIDLS